MSIKSKFLPLSLAFLTGFLLSLMLYFNGLLSDTTTLFYGSLFFHGFGTLIYLALTYLIFPRKKTTWYPKYMVPGLLNAIVIMGSAFAITNLGVTAFVSISLLGQLTASLIIDGFGLLGKEKSTIKKRQLIGLFVICVGVYLLV